MSGWGIYHIRADLPALAALAIMLVLVMILLGFGIHLIPDPAFALPVTGDIEEGHGGQKT